MTSCPPGLGGLVPMREPAPAVAVLDPSSVAEGKPRMERHNLVAANRMLGSLGAHHQVHRDCKSGAFRSANGWPFASDDRTFVSCLAFLRRCRGGAGERARLP